MSKEMDNSFLEKLSSTVVNMIRFFKGYMLEGSECTTGEKS